MNTQCNNLPDLLKVGSLERGEARGQLTVLMMLMMRRHIAMILQEISADRPGSIQQIWRGHCCVLQKNKLVLCTADLRPTLMFELCALFMVVMVF